MDSTIGDGIRIDIEDASDDPYYDQDGVGKSSALGPQVNEWLFRDSSAFFPKAESPCFSEPFPELPLEHYMDCSADSSTSPQQSTLGLTYQSDGNSSTDDLSRNLSLNLGFSEGPLAVASYPGSPHLATSPLDPNRLSPIPLLPSQSGYTSRESGSLSPITYPHWPPTDTLTVPPHNSPRRRSRERGSIGSYQGPYPRSDPYRRSANSQSGYYSDYDIGYDAGSPSGVRSRSSSVVSTSSSCNGDISDPCSESLSFGMTDRLVLLHPRDSGLDGPVSPLDSRHVSDNDDRSSGSQRQVGSEAITNAMSIRRKKPAKYFCEEPRCTSSFTTSQNLKYHQASHKGIKNFACEKCSKRFVTPHVAKRHEKTCSNGKSSSSSRQLSQSPTYADSISPSVEGTTSAAAVVSFWNSEDK